ncbi:MAG: hypothetical protein FRX49_13526 [Trebouxia sp. A1-2]|nr:MAG: hypothetical protein FRX49_13526 [Trebouxia sp. A1-2]
MESCRCPPQFFTEWVSSLPKVNGKSHLPQEHFASGVSMPACFPKRLAVTYSSSSARLRLVNDSGASILGKPLVWSASAPAIERRVGKPSPTGVLSFVEHFPLVRYKARQEQGSLITNVKIEWTSSNHSACKVGNMLLHFYLWYIREEVHGAAWFRFLSACHPRMLRHGQANYTLSQLRKHLVEQVALGNSWVRSPPNPTPEGLAMTKGIRMKLTLCNQPEIQGNRHLTSRVEGSSKGACDALVLTWFTDPTQTPHFRQPYVAPPHPQGPVLYDTRSNLGPLGHQRSMRCMWLNMLG